MSGTITQCVVTSFWVECFRAIHNFDNGTGDVFKMALFKSVVTGTYDASTTNYSQMTGNSDEVPNGSGYTTGGFTLTNLTPTYGGTTAFTSFTVTPTWPLSTISSGGALIYNSSKSNKAVALLSFGSTVSSSATTFTVTLPSADQFSAILRIVSGS